MMNVRIFSSYANQSKSTLTIEESIENGPSRPEISQNTRWVLYDVFVHQQAQRETAFGSRINSQFRHKKNAYVGINANCQGALGLHRYNGSTIYFCFVRDVRAGFRDTWF